MFKALCFVTGDRHEAADLMQDAFLKVWGALGLDRAFPSLPGRIHLEDRTERAAAGRHLGVDAGGGAAFSAEERRSTDSDVRRRDVQWGDPHGGVDRLWRQRIGEYVNEVASSEPLSAGRNSRVVEGVEFSFTVPDAGWGAFGTISINKSIVGPQGAEAQVDDADPCGQVRSSSIGSTTADLGAAVSTAPVTELVTGPPT